MSKQKAKKKLLKATKVTIKTYIHVKILAGSNK